MASKRRKGNLDGKFEPTKLGMYKNMCYGASGCCDRNEVN